jgi:glycosyltransferase involved in cell wall biosynthesis
MTPKRLLINVTEDWYFCSHRLPLAIAAKAAGYDVRVVTRVRNHGETIRAHGITLIPFEIVRSGLNPFSELGTLLRLIVVYRRERPDIAHHVAMKPVMYGSVAAWFAGTPRVVNALAGMGWLFISKSVLARVLKPMVRAWLRRALSSGIALVQNPDDARLVIQLGVPRPCLRLIPGSGVDLRRFYPVDEPPGVPVVVFPARLLIDKGVREFVQAARLLKQRGVAARFVLAGEPDLLNPASVTPSQVAAWVREEHVEHLGWVTNMPNLLAKAHVVCLPSYREGMPKSLLEAAAAGRAVVTSDVPGCRDAVRHGENGLLVPAGDVEALAAALARVIADPALRRQLGARGRERAVEEFGVDKVVQRTLSLYRDDPGSTGQSSPTDT